MPIQLFHPYRCRHCGTQYVILPGITNKSFLPVEVITGKEKDSGAYNKDEHKSHLLKCSKLQAQWESVKKLIYTQLNKQEKENLKLLLK
jgi:hypothetical protein